MKKRILFLFALVLLLCVFCFCSSAEEENRIVVDHVVYQLIPASEQTEAYYIVVKLFDSEEAKAGVKKIVIPSQIDGIPVTKIYCEDAYTDPYRSLTVKKIVLPDSIQVIGEKAFIHMLSLREINIPSSVVSIGPFAFNGCKKLKQITIPESVETIEECAFRDCHPLEQVCFLGNGLKRIERQAFYKCRNLKSIRFPSSLETIGDEAFSHSGLNTVRIPGNCIVKWCAFEYNNSLKKVVFEDRTDENDMFIQSYAFGYCSKLEKVYLPKESVGFNLLACVFEGCGKLKAIYRTDHIQSIGYHTFYLCKSLTSFTVPAEIQSIHRFAFSECTGLKKLRVLATDPAFLIAESKSAAFLKKLPKLCKVYVKTAEMQQAFLDAGCKNKVIVKADLK